MGLFPWLIQWYNLPYSLLSGLACLFLLIQLLGLGDSDSDMDVDTDLDLGVDAGMDADFGVDADIDVDLDVAVEAGPDIHVGDTGELDLDHDVDADIGGLAAVLGFINAGQAPFAAMMMAMTFFGGASGLMSNAIMETALSAYPRWFFPVSLLLSFVISVLFTRNFSKVFGKIFQDTSAATGPEDLVGCVGTVISGTVPEYNPRRFGRANVYNQHGVLLRVACVTHQDCLAPGKTAKIFVTGYNPDTRLHTVVIHESDDFYAYLSGHKNEMKYFEERLRKSQQALAEHQSDTRIVDGG